MSSLERPLIFISYASPDRARVLPFHDALKAGGFDVWMDVSRIKPGQPWDFEIKRALNRAALIIVFISVNSISRRGYIQREIRIALDKAMERLAGDIYLIPVLLDDDATVPDELKHLQFVRAADHDCVARIDDAIRHQLQHLGESIAEAQGLAHVRWSYSSYREHWDGLPGYETDFKLVHFHSERYTKIGEVTDIIRGRLLESVSAHRFAKLMQDHEAYNFGQDPFSRTDTWEAIPSEPKIVGRLLSTRYSVHWYGAGAAHPNQHFLAFCFLLDPLVRIGDLRNLFSDGPLALSIIQGAVRDRLLAPLPDGDIALSKEWVFEGTQDWDSFMCSSFEKDGIELAFSPYQVASYAEGAQIAKVPYDDLKPLMLQWLKNSLDLY